MRIYRYLAHLSEEELLPFAGLRHALKRKVTAPQIARRFRISNALVIYRMKVCRLWDDFKNLT